MSAFVVSNNIALACFVHLPFDEIYRAAEENNNNPETTLPDIGMQFRHRASNVPIKVSAVTKRLKEAPLFCA